MTVADPYPTNLAEIDEAELGFAPATAEGTLLRAVTALERIAIALEKGSQPVQNASGPALAALPPVRTPQAVQSDVCPIHGTPWKVVPAGVSKKTGKAYDAFRACSTQGCDQRPR